MKPQRFFVVIAKDVTENIFSLLQITKELKVLDKSEGGIEIGRESIHGQECFSFNIAPPRYGRCVLSWVNRYLPQEGYAVGC